MSLNKKLVLGIAALPVLGASLFLLVVLGGLAPVAATDEHSAIVRWSLHRSMESAVRRQAREVSKPAGLDLQDRALAEKAFGHYSVACTTCHGAPGRGADPWMVTSPQAPLLVQTASKWSDEELYWIIKNGIKMTGMPALGPTHKDEHLWAIAAFVRQLPSMTAAEYHAMAQRAQPSGTMNHAAHGESK